MIQRTNEKWQVAWYCPTTGVGARVPEVKRFIEKDYGVRVRVIKYNTLPNHDIVQVPKHESKRVGEGCQDRFGRHKYSTHS